MGIAACVTEQTASYSIEIKNESNEQLAVFTFIDVTADELQTLIADFRRFLGELSGTVVVNLVATPPNRER